MKKASAVFLALFVLSAGAAYPQSGFLKTGQSGLGISGAFATNSSASGFSGTAGAALAGIFDLSLSAGRVSYDPGTLGAVADLKATSIISEIRAYVVKQNSSKAPVSVSISFGYASDKFSSPDFLPDSITMRAHSLLLGGTVSRDVPLFNKAYIQPYAGIGYTSTTLKVSDPSGLTLSDTDGMVGLNLGVPFVYGLSESALVVLQPSLGLNKDTTTFAISLGLVIALTKPRG
jgi:hypothetical protein